MDLSPLVNDPPAPVTGPLTTFNSHMHLLLDLSRPVNHHVHLLLGSFVLASYASMHIVGSDWKFGYNIL